MGRGGRSNKKARSPSPRLGRAKLYHPPRLHRFDDIAGAIDQQPECARFDRLRARLPRPAPNVCRYLASDRRHHRNCVRGRRRRQQGEHLNLLHLLATLPPHPQRDDARGRDDS